MGAIVPTLVTKGLGYCCPWAFFKIFRKTPEIAARLGVTEQTVRNWKAKVDDGYCKCEGRGNCMKKQVHAVKLMGKKELGL